jgi:uncharacterized RDD family membrane protein YckC
MERTIDVATGESVAFSYELAGLGSRFFALFIDMAIQIGVLVAVIFGLALLATVLPNVPPRNESAEVAKIAAAIVGAIFYFALFMLFDGYFILFEWLWEGRTPGKRALGIRVVRDGGFPLDFTSSLIRNVIRIVEFAFGFYAVSAVVTLLSPQNRRLGDMAAGTIVVRDHRYERSRALGARELQREDPVVRELTPAQRSLVRSYAERRSLLTLKARASLAASIAAGVRPKLPASYEHLNDDELLVFLAENALA